MLGCSYELKNLSPPPESKGPSSAVIKFSVCLSPENLTHISFFFFKYSLNLLQYYFCFVF